MLINLTCLYCNYSWNKYLNSKKAINDQLCPKCGDSRLRVIDIASSSIDYYAGSPQFEEKKKSTNDELEQLEIASYFDTLYSGSD